MLSASARPDLSVVVPVYGCVDCLAELCRQIDEAVATLGIAHEILLVDDRSPDGAWVEVRRLSALHPSIVALRLSRNFGQQIAISAGLAEARGERVAVMDCDLQDPPALLSRLWARMDEGADIVMTRRVERSHSLFRVAAARTYFMVVTAVSGQRNDPRVGSYSLLSRKVVDAFVRFGEKERHYLFILRWLGFAAAEIDYEHLPRHRGRSSYSLARLISHSLDGILLQSTRLLKGIVGLGFGFALAGLSFALFLAWRVVFRTALPGWTSLAVLILIGTGVILISLGVIGAYIGKIFAQTKGRPLYIVDERIGGGE